MKSNNYSKSFILSLIFFPLGVLFSFKSINYTSLVSNLLLPVALILYAIVFIDIISEEFLMLLLGLNGIVSSQLLVDSIDDRDLSKGEDVFEGCSDSKIVYLIAPLLFFFAVVAFLLIFFGATKIFGTNSLNLSSLNNMNIILLLIPIIILIFLFFLKLYMFSKKR